MPHNLFPLESETGEQDQRDISWIQVTRWENGGFKFAPQLFPADEVADLDALHQMFGGGQFEVIGRIMDKSRISARKRYALPGPSKPLAPADAAAVVERGAPAGPASSDPMLAFFGMMMQQQQAQSQMMTQVMVAALSGRNQPVVDHSGPVVKALSDMAANKDAQITRLVSDLATRGQAGGGSMDAIMKAMELGAKLANGNAGGDESELMNTLAGLLHGAMAQQAQMGPGGPPGGGSPPTGNA